MSNHKVDRRKYTPSEQYSSVCKEEFDQIKASNNKAHKKIKKGQQFQQQQLDIIKQKIFNGHSTAIDMLGKQNKWIMGLIGGMFFVLLAAVVTFMLTRGGSP